MRHLFPLFLVLSCLLTLLPGCEPKEDMVQTSGKLEFAADTVLFDTVFTTIGTVTKRLWVYNRNSGAVKTDVRLLGTANPTYSLVINGDAGPAVSGLTIRGKDSLLVLVRAVLGDNGQSTVARKFIVDDEIHFLTNGNDQSVKLLAYGQNAYFHRGDRISANTTWATDKPHVLFNAPTARPGGAVSAAVLVDPGIILSIPKGARIYAHSGAIMLIDGTLRVNDDFQPPAGSTNDTVKASNPNIVRFQGDRLESGYANIPGQWGGIFFTASSRNNRIRYTEIKNATFGALIYNPDATAFPDLTLENTSVRNISGSNISFANASSSDGGGIISFSGAVTATNCLFTNCGEYAIVGIGGAYDLNFCTIANYTPSFRREKSSLSFTNVDENKPTIKLLTSVRIRNSIVWGSFEDELFVKNYTDYNPAPVILNNLLRTKEYATNAAVIGGATANIINQEPLFTRTGLLGGTPDYSLQDDSPANKPRRPAAGAITGTIARDILNLPRPSPGKTQPSLGAYEHK